MSKSQRDALSRVVAVANFKGGVLKTSIAVNVAGELAAHGNRVLVQDLDPQANVARELGVPDEQNDGGRGFFDALLWGKPLSVVPNVRPNLDFIAGGKGVNLVANSAELATLGDRYVEALAAVAGDYDMVVLDCPPVLEGIVDLALQAARWVLIPVNADVGAVDGLFTVGRRVQHAREKNPTLDYLGTVLTNHATGATAVEAQVRAVLGNVELASTMDTFIRRSESAGWNTRLRGMLVRELARSAPSKSEALSRLARSKRGDDTVPAPEFDVPHIAALDGLARDYANLAQEISARIIEAETR